MKTKLNMKQLREAIVEKSKVIGQVFEEAGEDLDFSKVKSLEGADTTAKLEKLHAIEDELKDLKEDYEEYTALVKSRQLADEATKFTAEVSLIGEQPGQQSKKSLGLMIVEGKGEMGHGKAIHLDVDLKTDFFLTAGWAPENLRQPGFVPSPQRPITVVDQLPIFPTTQNSIVYMLESTLTNNAAEKSEGGAAAESALALTETSQAVQEIGTFIPVSKVQLEDVPAAEAYLNQRLGYLVRARLDSQILNGDGSAPNLKGTANIGGSLQTQAKGSDPTPDAIYKAFTKVRSVGFAEPSALFAHPNDWQDVRLLRTADGVYIWGSPADPGPDRIWGVKVVQTTAATENTMITGDYANFAAVYLRRGLDVEMSSGYSDYFVKGKLAVLATLRCAVVHTRTAAFATVTGV